MPLSQIKTYTLYANCLFRTKLLTAEASYTLFLINYRLAFANNNSICRTTAFAFATSYTPTAIKYRSWRKDV